jgi:ABC-2 type transport system ATP-binding protein
LEHGKFSLDAIETRGLTKEYKKWFSFAKNLALDDLNLSVPTGSVFGFLGLNGAGKTTTIKLLLGLAKASGGDGSILGRPLGDLKAKEKIGFLPEEAYFQRHLTSTEFLNFCAKTLHMDADHRKIRIQEMLELVSMTDKAHTKLQHFSKGMLQRIGVAQALLNDPDLIIFDEPLTGLDPVGRTQLKEIMLGLQARGKTVFFSSHILSDVQAICDRVSIMNKGQLIYQGEIDNLLDVDTVDIAVEEVPSMLLDPIEKVCDGMTKKDGRWVFNAKSERVKEDVHRLLLENNLKVHSESLTYKELEPVFLEKIEKNNQERGLS